MSRPLRIEFPGTYYHLMNRGLARQGIFTDRYDREANNCSKDKPRADLTRWFFFILLISFLFICQAKVALALVITSPENGATFNEGDTITIRVTPSAGDPNFRFVQILSPLGSQECPELANPPYECNVSLPHGSSREAIISALAQTVNDTIMKPQDVKIFVRVTAVLQGLKVNEDQRNMFSTVGTGKKLYVYGVYSDGVDRRLDDPSSGTTYKTSDPKIATVDGNGMVEAVAPGKAAITVKNGDKELQIQVTVIRK